MTQTLFRKFHRQSMGRGRVKRDATHSLVTAPHGAFTPQPTNTAHFLLTALRSMLGASRALHRGITVIRSEKKLI